MKLLSKTNRAYMALTASAFIIAGLAIYISLNFILNSQIEEKISNDRLDIIKNLQKSGSMPFDPPYVEVKEIGSVSSQAERSVDTVIFDPDETEEIPVRQCTSNVSIDGKHYMIILRKTLVEKSDILLTIIVVIGSVFFLLLTCTYFINKRLSLLIWKPFYSTLEDLKNFSYESGSFSITSSSEIAEFSELNAALEKLTKKVISDYNSLKRFTEDASHEIQTPLAIINSRLESLLQYPDLRKEEADLIQSAINASNRLTRLTKALLMLSKIENRQFEENEETDFSEILVKQLVSVRSILAEKSILTEEKIVPGFITKANNFLVESLISNLLGNAIKNSFAGNKIVIELDSHIFRIANSGTPITVPPEKLFERFFKINKSSDSPGLGLSIVKKICEINEWYIEYKNIEDLHIVTIIF